MSDWPAATAGSIYSTGDWPAATAGSIYSTNDELQPCLIGQQLQLGLFIAPVMGYWATAVSEWLAVATWSIYSAGDVSVGSNCSWIYL